MTTVASTEPGAGQCRKAPGRPRDARADDAIIEAVIAMLGSGQSADAVSIEAVAAKAGVGKATIYRRWPNKEALLVDAVSRMKGPIPVPEGKSVREDLVMLASQARTKRVEGHSRAMACLFPEMVRSPQLRFVFQAVIEPRREVMRGVLRRGVETGELRPDLDINMTVLLLTAPNLSLNLFGHTHGVPEEGYAEALIDAILLGAATRPAPAPGGEPGGSAGQQ